MSSGVSESESNPWGWVIFRTCYTPESENLWANAIRLVHTWLDHKTRLALQERGEEDEHEEVMAQLDNVLIEDPSLENASFDHLRSRFATWLATQDTDNPDGNRHLPLQRFKEFIVLDSRAPKTYQVQTIGRPARMQGWRHTSKLSQPSTQTGQDSYRQGLQGPIGMWMRADSFQDS